MDGQVDDTANGLVRELCKRFWRWRLEEWPQFATYVGFPNFADRLDKYSEEVHDARKKACEGFLDEAKRVPLSRCSKDEEFNLLTLQDALETYITGVQYGGYYNVVSLIFGVDYMLATVIKRGRFATYQDYKNTITRFKQFPAQVEDVIALSLKAISKGYFPQIKSAQMAIKRLNAKISVEMGSGDFGRPFKNMPQEFSPVQRTELENDAALVLQDVQEALIKFRTHIQQDVVPRCFSKDVVSVQTLPNGKAMYACALSLFVASEYTPEIVHQLGLDKVKKTREKMEQIMKRAGFSGSFSEYRKHLSSDRSLFCNSAEELLQYYRDLLDKRIRPKLKDYFDFELENKMIVSETYVDVPVAALYLAPSSTGDGDSRPGEIQVTCSHLDERPKYDVPTLALHEGEPGHHHQACFVLEYGNLPEFRTYKDDTKYHEAPSCFPLYSAYTEGWALYCEELGIEMGIYEDDKELFGYYSSDILRSCRVVVDTGVHAFGWTREKAVEYLLENSGLPMQRVEEEIFRYRACPAQGCSYTVGQLKFLELRERAENILGSAFDIKAFHRACLACGQVPLHLLDRSVQQYIDQQIAQI